jgi:CRISPR-associated endonuclease/helicase Cas3
MTSRTNNYEHFFQIAFGKGEAPQLEPFDYQKRLAIEENFPSVLNVPTGAGKTNAVLGAWLWRRLTNSASVGRRLIYCLPMRVLVEQTAAVAKRAIRRLEQNNQIKKNRFVVHVLQGGEVENDWDAYPEREAILIGTQDMLLSRALNRGYALSRFRWSAHFALLNNDCFWVFDEIQLMSDGLATTTQLAAFREKFGAFGSYKSLWMSATLDKSWLATVDFREKTANLETLQLSEKDRENEILQRRLNAVKKISAANSDCRLPAGLADFVRKKHERGTQTLIIVNRVQRAREVYRELRKIYGFEEAKKGGQKSAENALSENQEATEKPEIVLLHSRFRPKEREEISHKVSQPIDKNSAGRIIIATQVVEAGVDISSKLLITDLAPFASLVQRFGRCNRFGEHTEAQIFWIDLPLTEKDAEKFGDKSFEAIDEKEREKLARPYTWENLATAREILLKMDSASLRDLPEHADAFSPAHVLRRRDLVELFDATPDLSGYDLDISRFVRSAEDSDASVYWRAITKDKPFKYEREASRRELCSVPLHELKDFIKKNNDRAWVWNALENDWEKATENNLRPGITVLLEKSTGGYDQKLGWHKDLKAEVTPLDEDERTRKNEAYDDDLLAETENFGKSYAQILAAHSFEVRQKAEQILDSLGDLDLKDFRAEILQAAQHHDWGKAHEIFQRTLHRIESDEEFERRKPLSPVLAKARTGGKHSRKHFRHELASALALMQEDASDLCVYLAAAHHGKVRLSIRALPGETKPDGEERKFARGIWDGERLPETDLGDGVLKSEITLDLEPMLLGSENGEASWLERMLNLRDSIGVFRLAFLEALVRAADVQASKNPIEILPATEVSEDE